MIIENFTKKFFSIFLVFLICMCLCAELPVLTEYASAVPAFAASTNNKNPFMDVPEGSWAYEAIARLTSRGIITGYPDGLYKGKQSLTRYEAASITARAASYFDGRKASLQDAETLKRLIAEFREEIDALGVRVDRVGRDTELFKKRLGGWRFSGYIRMDIEHRSAGNISNTAEGGNVGIGGAKFNIERSFGEKNGAYFLTQFLVDNVGNDSVQTFDIHRFYAKIPFYFGSFVTVGMAGADDLDARFAYETPGTGRYATFGWFDDSPHPMVRLDLNFAILNFTAYVAHGAVEGAGGSIFNNNAWERYSPHAWNIFTNFDVRLNQYLGFGLGAQYLIHDDWDVATTVRAGEGQAWNNIFTAWLGVDYDIFDGATIHGIVYYQRAKTEDSFWGSGNLSGRPDGGTAWRVALDLSQDLLKFTNLYAEYMRVPNGFFALEGIDSNILLSDAEYDEVSYFNNVADNDISMWKIGANQRWNDKLSTWLFYADINGSGSEGYSDIGTGLRQYGLGIEYTYSSSVIFGLNYLKWEGKESWKDKDYSRVRFTTQLSF